MDTIVKVLNEKVEEGNAKTIVEALKQIDTSAEGDTVAEVLKNMNLGGGGGLNVPHTTVKMSVAKLAITPKECFEGIIFENNLVWPDVESLPSPTMAEPVSVGDECEVTVLYQTYGPLGDVCSAFIVSARLVESSNLINCSLDEDGTLIITDPSADSEITIVVQGRK